MIKFNTFYIFMLITCMTMLFTMDLSTLSLIFVFLTIAICVLSIILNIKRSR